MDRLRIVCTGLIGSIPMAGLTMHYLQYMLGLRALGHEVLYLEDTGAWNYDPDADVMTDDVTLPVACLRTVMAGHGLSDSWTFIDHRGGQYGVAGGALDAFIESADVFLNVTGAGMMRDAYHRIPVRAYVDTDPGYIQMRVANGSPKDAEHLGRHTHHFSFGRNIGKERCRIPTVGIEWLPTSQPIVRDCWPVRDGGADERARFTTILKWQSYDPVEHDGRTYGLKNEEFMRFVDLPGRVQAELELATAGAPPVDDLSSRGWHIRGARAISDSVDHYRAYIQDSKAEWSIAKNGYVKSRSGWFGDRSASYLASGKPVVLQSTGFEAWLETGLGVHAFHTVDEAAAAIETVCGNYPVHRQAAVELAADVFDARKVLTDLLGRACA